MDEECKLKAGNLTEYLPDLYSQVSLHLASHPPSLIIVLIKRCKAFQLMCRVAIDTSHLLPGVQQASLQVTGTDSSNQSVLATADLLIVLASTVQADFSSIQRLQSNVAAVAATVSVSLPLQNVAVTTNLTLSSSGGTPHITSHKHFQWQHNELQSRG